MAFQQLSVEEKLAFARNASLRFQDAKTFEDVQAVFQAFYMTLGHKALGRMLLGQSPEKALRIS